MPKLPKRWLSFLIVAELMALGAAFGWTVNRVSQQSAQTTPSAPKVVPAQWSPYTVPGDAEASGQPSPAPASSAASRFVAPPHIPFRTGNPPADALNVRPVYPAPASPRVRADDDEDTRDIQPLLPRGSKPVQFNGATVYVEPLTQ